MGIGTHEVTQAAEGSTEGGRRFCTARTKAGRVCGGPVLRDGSGFCWTHSPALAEKRREAQRRGGATTAARRALLLGRLIFGTSEEIRQGRQALASAVIQGQVTPQRATVIAALLRDAEAGLPRAELEKQIGELSETLARLEREQ